jgi:hypothetical protein
MLLEPSLGERSRCGGQGEEGALWTLRLHKDTQAAHRTLAKSGVAGVAWCQKKVVGEELEDGGNPEDLEKCKK